MRYIGFYRIMKLMVPTGRDFLRSILFVILYMVVVNQIWSEPGVTSIGFTVIFMMAVFIMSAYARQMRFEPSCPVWDYPLSAKERVTYSYVSVLVTFLGTLVFFLAIGLMIGGLVAAFGNITIEDGAETPTNIAGDLYALAWNIVIMAYMFPLSYVEGDKKRTVLVLVGFSVFGLFNVLLGTMLTGEFFIRSDIRSLFIGSEGALVSSILFLVAAACSMVVSYRLSLRMNSYQKT